LSAPFDVALLVEDETALAETLKIALARLKIPEILHATTIEAARKLLGSHSVDCLILDRNLPDGDGLSLCEELRAQNFSGAILCLTAKGEIEDRVEGLESGADDYLSKPFHWEELAARIRALSRRKEKKVTPKTLWTIEAARLRILGTKVGLELTPPDFMLATNLIQAPGSIVPREDLST